MPDPDPQHLDAAVTQAKQQWPRLADWNVKLSAGKGEGWSETYPPDEQGNPTPGSWHVQLRGQKALSDPSVWPETVGLESLHWLQNQDPQFQNYTEQFIKSMTPDQHADARQAYTKELAQAYQQGGPVGSNMSSYDNWLRKVQALEYIRGGGMFPQSDWVKSGEGRYTPGQMQLMGQITNYLQTPNSNTHPQAAMLNKLRNNGLTQ